MTVDEGLDAVNRQDAAAGWLQLTLGERSEGGKARDKDYSARMAAIK